MTSMMTEPGAMNILIDSRIEQLRGGRVLPGDPPPSAQLAGNSER